MFYRNGSMNFGQLPGPISQTQFDQNNNNLLNFSISKIKNLKKSEDGDAFFVKKCIDPTWNDQTIFVFQLFHYIRISRSNLPDNILYKN